MPHYDWEWERTDPGRPGMSGDLAKLFRHEDPKQPGAFAIDPPTAAATLLAREVIQNSWDAALDLQNCDPNVPQFEIDFEFERLRRTEKRSLVESIRLGSLAQRLQEIDRNRIGLRRTDCLDTIGVDDTPLSVLKIIEHAASGMYGPWHQAKSHMFLALLSLGFTQKLSGAGGSYGYGKAGLINGSRIRSVVAYSCFRAAEEEREVTRRLLGVTYWGQHDVDGTNHPGIGTLSAGSAGEIEPFVNDEADEIALQMGFDVRSPADPEDLGTSFLLIDTPIEPSDLVSAIERSWWPAIQEGDFSVTVKDFDGGTLRPRPMRDPVLHTFIEAWEIAKGRSQPGPEDHFAEPSGPDTPSVEYDKIGQIGLVSNLSDWSYADQTAGPGDTDVSHKSLVALTRGTRMVVEYLVAGHSPPYIRGVFVADPALDDILRRTEPKAHNAWESKGDDDEVDQEAAAVADHVIRRIKSTVQNHRARLKPPTPPPEEVNLPFFNEIMGRVMSGIGKGVRQPIPETRPISIRLEYQPREAHTDGLIEVAGSATYALSDHFDGDAARVSLHIAYRFIEDERVGEYADLNVMAPAGFEETETGVFEGILEHEGEVRFEFSSEPYEPNWSGRLIVNGEIKSVLSRDGIDR